MKLPFIPDFSGKVAVVTGVPAFSARISASLWPNAGPKSPFWIYSRTKPSLGFRIVSQGWTPSA
jgi:hypothetical protein